MRRLQRIAGTGNAARANGAKAERAVLVRGAAAKSNEGGIERGILSCVLGMRVAARGVGLPNLESGNR